MAAPAPQIPLIPPAVFLSRLSEKGVTVSLDENEVLVVRGLAGWKTPRVDAYLKKRKPELLALLREGTGESRPLPTVAPSEVPPELPAHSPVPSLNFALADLMPCGHWFGFSQIARAMSGLGHVPADVRASLMEWDAAGLAQHYGDMWRRLPVPDNAACTPVVGEGAT